MSNKLMIIDGNDLIHRSFHAFANSKVGLLKNRNGIPVNSILVFAKMINKFVKTYQPSHLLIAFDAGKKTNRHDQYPQYKAKRPPTAPELIVQIPLIKEMLNHMKIRHHELLGFEADDIIGTAAKTFAPMMEIVIVSSDQDMFQLIDDKISVIVPQTGSRAAVIYDSHSFSGQKGYKPTQVTDIKGLVGDRSDNLPGVKGVGPKTAVTLINKYDNLDSIYNHLPDIKVTLQEKLLASKEHAYLSKKLATIITDLDLPFNLDALMWSFASIKKTFIDFVNDVGVKSLIPLFNLDASLSNKKKSLSSKIFF